MTGNLSEEVRQPVRVPSELPSTWQWAPLVEVCRPKQWPTISKDQLLTEGYVVFGANGPIGFYSEFTHAEQTIAITCRGATCGTVNLVPAKSYITGNAMALDDLDRSRVSLPYLHQSLIYRGLSDVTSGSAQPQITRQGLAPILLPVPPLGEQKKIAAILSSVDEAIEATQAVIDQLQVVKKAMMAELLTRGLPGRHTRFKQTEIGEVPEEWEVVRAESVFADGPSNGRSPPSKASPPGIPTFSISAVRRGRVNIMANMKYADGDVDALRGALVRKDDILIVRGNGNPELVGLCGMLMHDPPSGCIYPDILMRVRTTEAMLSEFFVPLWNSPVLHKQVLDKAKTTNGTYKINGQDVRDILLPLPPKSEQQAIGQLLLSLDGNQEAHAAQLGALQELKGALMSVLLTGEVRVKPDEDAS